MENVINLIKQDHDEIAELFSEVRRYLYEDRNLEPELQASFEKLRQGLVAHLNAEEEAVYTQLKEKEATHDFAFEGAAEHEVALDLLEKLTNDSVFDEKWRAEFMVLKGEVERHVEVEELEILPLMKKLFSEFELSEMATDMKSLKSLIQDTAFTPSTGLKIGRDARGGRPEAAPSV